MTYAKLLTVLIISVSTLSIVTSDQDASCPSGMETIQGATLDSCYGLVDPAEGTKSFWGAKMCCYDGAAFGLATILIAPKTKEELRAIVTWAVGKSLPADGLAGVWANYHRFQSDGNRTDGLSSNDRFFFLDFWFGTYMPVDLWRNHKQKGDGEGREDERCTAQKKPGELDQYIGLDDYPCDSFQNHYVICEYPKGGLARG